MKLPIYTKLERAKEFIRFFVEKYIPKCCFCGGIMNWEVFFPKISRLQRDDWTIHHLDHNRENNKPENKALSHRDCHRKHHREEQIFKELNPNKKYIYIAYISTNLDITRTYKV